MMKYVWLSLIFTLFAHSSLVQSSMVKDLKYGTILFDYYQQKYFDSLIGYEYAKEKKELVHNRDDARLLQGGMMLSYGLPNEAKAAFSDLLNDDVDLDVRNKAWFLLAKLYYQKGDIQEAVASIANIKGKVPSDIVEEYNYLATLLNIKNNHLVNAQNAIGIAARNTAYEPYLIFNLAVSQLKNGNEALSKANLRRVIAFAKANPKEEFLVLADRAKQALAHTHIQKGDMLGAWQHLQNVRTTGLYSNRALLSYGWTAIKLQRYAQAIPALTALNKRSISIAEVQEAKVLLAHLYEQKGATRFALKQYLLAEKAFTDGIKAIEKARAVIDGQRIPQEFVLNLEAMMDETDWYGSQPSLDYNKLTPFLVELMSSNAFHSVIKELRDLYAIRGNLDYWARQASEHQLIISHRQQGLTSKSIQAFLDTSEKQQEEYEYNISDLRLHTMTLDVEEQDRFTSLLEATKQDFEYLDDKLNKISRIKEPYRQSEKNNLWAKSLHGRTQTKITETNQLINQLEGAMRIVVNAELDNHEERMRYYWAQARLGKARLYDETLNSIEVDAIRKSGARQ